MRVVIDTNVVVSAVINPNGTPARVLNAVLSGRLMLLYDERILAEYRGVLLRPVFGFNRADVDALLDFLELSGMLLAGQELPVDLPDATDLPFLEVAVAGQADALITGNIRHFRPRRGRREVRIMSPAEFMRDLVRKEHAPG